MDYKISIVLYYILYSIYIYITMIYSIYYNIYKYVNSIIIIKYKRKKMQSLHILFNFYVHMYITFSF